MPEQPNDKNQEKNVSRNTGAVGKRLLTVLVDAGEGFLDGLYSVVAHPHMNFSKYNGSYRSLYWSAKRLERRGLISIENKGKKLKVILTKQGYQYATKLDFLNIQLEKPLRWDGRWRFIIFDIPEEHKIVREVLREKIKKLGFMQLQKSVFITPWPCEDVVRKIQKIYKADKYIRHVQVLTFDGARYFEKQFGLNAS